MTEVPAVDPEERSQTRTLIRHDHFDEEPVGKHILGVSDDGSDSLAPSRATDAASLNRDSGYSDATMGSRNFTPGSKEALLQQHQQHNQDTLNFI